MSISYLNLRLITVELFQVQIFLSVHGNLVLGHQMISKSCSHFPFPSFIKFLPLVLSILLILKVILYISIFLELQDLQAAKVLIKLRHNIPDGEIKTWNA